MYTRVVYNYLSSCHGNQLSVIAWCSENPFKCCVQLHMSFEVLSVYLLSDELRY